jgi:hypothetical protein
MKNGKFWRVDWSNFRKIRLDTLALKFAPALNAMDREAFGSELGGRKKVMMCRYRFLVGLTTLIAGVSHA